jgi:phage shock protein C
MEQHKSLQRSRTDTVISGVAGGIANYLNIDPTIVRVIFVLLALFGGGGVLIYIILWIAVPIESGFNSFGHNNYNQANPGNTDPNAQQANENENSQNNSTTNIPDWRSPSKRMDGSLIAGLAMITIGTIFLVDHFVPRIDFEDLWPIILLVAGIALVRAGYVSKKKETDL